MFTICTFLYNYIFYFICKLVFNVTVIGVENYLTVNKIKVSKYKVNKFRNCWKTAIWCIFLKNIKISHWNTCKRGDVHCCPALFVGRRWISSGSTEIILLFVRLSVSLTYIITWSRKHHSLARKVKARHTWQSPVWKSWRGVLLGSLGPVLSVALELFVVGSPATDALSFWRHLE